MSKLLLKSAVVAGLVILACGAQAAAIPLPGLTNLNFLSYSGAAPKNSFTAVNPTGWTGGDGLIFIDKPGDASNPNSACGSIYLSTYGCPSTLAIPGGYNYVEADGNPDYEGSFNYHLSGLTAGQTYSLSFYQAGSQQKGFANGMHTTEQWIVSLGTAGMDICNGCGAGDPYFGLAQSTYSNTDPNASIVVTDLMTTPSGGLTDWQYVSIELTASASDQLLSFLAWGNNGTTANLPPIVFLAGVNSAPGLNVPEPSSVALVGLSLLGLVAVQRRRQRSECGAIKA